MGRAASSISYPLYIQQSTVDELVDAQQALDYQDEASHVLPDEVPEVEVFEDISLKTSDFSFSLDQFSIVPRASRPARPSASASYFASLAMGSGGCTDEALSDLMVEVFSSAHRSGRFIPKEEPLLGTYTCRFPAVSKVVFCLSGRHV